MENCFVEMSACFGSWHQRPAMDHQGQRQLADFIAVSRGVVGKRTLAKPCQARRKLKHDFDYISLYHLMLGNIETGWSQKDGQAPSGAEELNCGACGHKPCREKGLAVYQGKAEISMCLPYLLGKAQSFSRYHHQQHAERHFGAERIAGNPADQRCRGKRS